jgi:hypothetical protein
MEKKKDRREGLTWHIRATQEEPNSQPSNQAPQQAVVQPNTRNNPSIIPLCQKIWEGVVLIPFLVHGGQRDAVAIFTSSLSISPRPIA